MPSSYLFVLTYPLIAADDKPSGSPSVRVKCPHHQPRTLSPKPWQQASSAPKGEVLTAHAEAQLVLWKPKEEKS